jgi:hypothetical protein
LFRERTEATALFRINDVTTPRLAVDRELSIEANKKLSLTDAPANAASGPVESSIRILSTREDGEIGADRRREWLLEQFTGFESALGRLAEQSSWLAVQIGTMESMYGHDA